MRRQTRDGKGRSESDGQKGGLKAALEAEIVAEIESLIGPGAADTVDFEALEMAARRQALQVAARAIERRFNADLSDHTASSIPCTCGAPARYAGRQNKTITTALGEMTLSRAYFHCAACHKGFSPRDQALGISLTAISPAVTRMIGSVGAMVSFAEGRELLDELAGVRVNAKQVERTAEGLGAEIAKDERLHVESDCETVLPPTLYLGMDGTGVPMRTDELTGRKGKQTDGSSRTREVKICTVWSAEGRDDEGIPVRDQGSITYTAAIESAAARDTDESPADFAKRAFREATRRRFDQVERRVVLGDGAPWIWNIASEQFPDAVQIVDRFHVKQHLSDVGKAIYGATSELANAWSKQRHDELDEGKTDLIIAALTVHAGHCNEARKCVNYIETNMLRMRYPLFREQGLCTSTGVVEAGCKVAVGTRLKRAGMHWTVAGADAIIALRCCKLSGRFEDFWERRVAAATTRVAV
jgi:hypothetical protein